MAVDQGPKWPRSFSVIRYPLPRLQVSTYASIYVAYVVRDLWFLAHSEHVALQ